MKINNNNKNYQQNKNFINNNFNNQYESQKNNQRVLSSNTKPFTISFGNNKFTTNNNIINNNNKNFNINNYNANYFFNNQNFNFPPQNINNNIKYLQSNNFSQHKPRLYSKPFSVKKSLNSRVKEYSIYQNNNLDTSQVYDLHKARLRHIKKLVTHLK